VTTARRLERLCKRRRDVEILSVRYPHRTRARKYARRVYPKSI
jgi:hypothetical protein